MGDAAMNEPVTRAEFQTWRNRAIAGFIILWLSVVVAFIFTWRAHQDTLHLATESCQRLNSRGVLIIDAFKAEHMLLLAEAHDRERLAAVHERYPAHGAGALAVVDLHLARLDRETATAIHLVLLEKTLVRPC